MLVEPQETPYDLRFQLFGTRVRVHPFFWLFSAIFGWSFLERGFGYLLIWIACAFLSILLHEFGHIWMGKLFGSDGYVVLYSFGGLAVGANESRARWQRILVSLAGPGIQLVLYGLLRLGLRTLSLDQIAQMSDPVRKTWNILLYINLYWPLLNLLPIWPLDGGRVCREICSAISPREGLRWSLMVSIAAAGVLVVNSVYALRNDYVGFLPHVTGDEFTMIFFALLAVQSFQLLAVARQAQPWEYEEADDRLPWER
jgi:stage IV sporulation protein FB